MNVRALLRGSLLYTLGNFLPRVGLFLLLPVYAAAMAPSEFGVLSLMLSLAGLLAIVYRLGLDGALLRLHFDVPPPRRPSLYLSSALTTLGAAVALSVVIGLLVAPFFPRIFPGVAFVPYGVIVLALTVTTSLQYVPAVLFRAGERPDRFLSYAIGVFVLGTVATLFFLLVLQRGAGGALAGQLVGGLAVAAITALILSRMPRARFDAGLVRESLRFGLPLVPHGVAAWILNLSDRLLIGLLIGLPTLGTQAAIGIYSFGYVLGQGIALVALSFNAAWVPFWYARGDGERGPSLLREVTTLSMGGLALLTVMAASLAPEVTRLFASLRWGFSARAAGDVIVVVSLASLVYGLYFMLVSTIFLRRRTGGLPLLTLAAGAANVASNVVLIPRFGIAGAAWSTVVGYGTLTALTWWYAARDYPIGLDLRRLAAIGVGVAAAILLARLVRWEESGLWLSTGYHLGVAAAFGLGLAPLLLGPMRRLRALLGAERQAVAAAGAGTMGHPEEHP
ncbi:MAG TPA: oligosaccharide flippase family protein [Candidatus Limnocylindria bacterium]|nr:oligosaccharide flippase family protein [Candidatus Limnocylindria bacterium]